MEETVMDRIMDAKQEAVNQLFRFIKENDIHDGQIDGIEDYWKNSFELEKELDKIVLRLAKITELLEEIEPYAD